jgi:hypothetical protein
MGMGPIDFIDWVSADLSWCWRKSERRESRRGGSSSLVISRYFSERRIPDEIIDWLSKNWEKQDFYFVYYIFLMFFGVFIKFYECFMNSFLII